MTFLTTGRPAWTELSRWLWPVLMVSLALNLAIAGQMLGKGLRATPAANPNLSTRVTHDASASLARELSPQKRAEVRAVFEAAQGKNRALWVTVRERRAEVVKQLEAEPFDRQAYVAAMTGLIEAESVARTAAQPTFAEVAARLSQQERHDFLATHRQLRQQLMGPPRENDAQR